MPISRNIWYNFWAITCPWINFNFQRYKGSLVWRTFTEKVLQSKFPILTRYSYVMYVHRNKKNPFLPQFYVKNTKNFVWSRLRSKIDSKSTRSHSEIFDSLDSLRLTLEHYSKHAKMAVFQLPEFLKLISRKIWAIEKSWNFHTVWHWFDENYFRTC